MPPRKSHCRVVTPPESEPTLPNVAPALQPEASTSQDNVGPGDVPGNDERAHGGSGPEIRVNNQMLYHLSILRTLRLTFYIFSTELESGPPAKSAGEFPMCCPLRFSDINNDS